MEGNAAEILLITVAVIGLVFCLVAGPWMYKVWTTRSLYLKDFENLASQARLLNEKTLEVKQDVDRDTTAAECIKITNQELVDAAGEWDNGIRAALAAWEDFIEKATDHEDMVIDPEKQKQRSTKELGKQRKNHAKFMIKLMRAKVTEGISQREELSVQLHRIHMAVKSRGSKLEAAQANRRLSNGRDIWVGKGTELEKDSDSFASSEPRSPAKEVPSLDSVLIASGPIGPAFQ